MRIVVAMSGGVDSSVAAGLLHEAGHEVSGVSMQLYDASHGFGSCCTIDDLHDARRVAAHLGFPHYIVNFESHFHRHVQANFLEEYAAGRTPIPCAHCNREVKFKELLARAEGYGAAISRRTTCGARRRVSVCSAWPTSPTARRSASCPTATTRASSNASSRPSPPPVRS
jgi:tRNA-specific 2-thiouridylase